MQSLIVKLKGLYTHASEISEVPEGALAVADDIVINRESVAEPRRGFDLLGAAFSVDTSLRANKLFFYQNKPVLHYSTNKLAYYTAGAWTNYSTTHTPPANPDTTSAYTTIKVRSAEANQNIYFTTSTGVYKLDAYNGTPQPAGAYKALDIQASISTVPTAAWLSTNYAVAYRVVWGYKDANNNLVLSSPSQRSVVVNTGAINDVTVTITIPDGVTTAWFYQVYRSSAVDNSTSDIEPSDELGLVYEGNPTAGEITAKLSTVIDITPDELRGATIYTAQTQEGLANQNEPPPYALDVAIFKGRLFLGNIKSKYRYYLSLLAEGSPNGIQVNDTISVQMLNSSGTVASTVTYTAKAAETIASKEFKVYTTGSASQNVRDTAISLARVINRNTSSTVNVYYVSGPDDLPGKLLLEEESIGGYGFAVKSSRATCWSPALPSSGITEAATNDYNKNGIAYSKESRPDAIPLGNRFYAGSADKAILRIVALRDSLFVFKEDGIYRVSGTDDTSFRIELFDSSARLLAPESVAVLNNQIYAMTDQGAVTVSESGVSVKSRPIESTLLELQGLGLDTFRNLTFGAAYETERKYILFVQSSADDTSPTQAFVYNTFTNSWTRWVLSKTCAGVNPADDKLYLGSADSNTINIERKTFTFADYADYKSSATISSIVGTTITFSGDVSIDVGDCIIRDSKYAIVSSITSSTVIEATFAPTFTTGATSICSPIRSKVKWVPFTLGNPGALKQFREMVLLFKSDFSGDAEIGFTSDQSAFEETESVTGSGAGPWGLFAWGEVLWGGSAARRPIRVYVPRNKQRCTQLSAEFRHSNSFTSYLLTGISLVANAIGERVGR